MFHVILIILKILGIILLSILGLFLLISCCILFVPIKYRIRGEMREEIKGVIKITWLFHILSIRAVYYDKEFRYKAKLFNIPVFRNDKEKKIKTKRTKSKRRQSEQEQEEITTEDEPAPPVKIQSTEEFQKPSSIQHEEFSEIPEEQKSFITKITDKVKNFYYKIKNFILSIIRHIKDFFRKIIALKENIAEKINDIRELIQDEENKKLLRFLFEKLKYLGNHIKPRHYKIYIKYGSKEPDVTGKVVAYTAMANTFLNLRLNFVPVFNDAVFEANVLLKGRVRLFIVLKTALQIYKNNQLKKMLRRFN